MGKIYARKIMGTTDGSYTIANVPNLWMPKTMAAFSEFVQTGEITADQFEQYTGKNHQLYLEENAA